MTLRVARSSSKMWATPGDPRVFPSTKGPCVFPHDLALGFPGLALNEEAAMGLLPISTAPPTLVRRDLVDFIAKVVPTSPRAPTGVASARQGFPLVSEFFIELVSFRRFVPAPPVDVLRDPGCDPLRSCLRSRAYHVSEASLSRVLSGHHVAHVFSSHLCLAVCYFVQVPFDS